MGSNPIPSAVRGPSARQAGGPSPCSRAYRRNPRPVLRRALVPWPPWSRARRQGTRGYLRHALGFPARQSAPRVSRPLFPGDLATRSEVGAELATGSKITGKGWVSEAADTHPPGLRPPTGEPNGPLAEQFSGWSRWKKCVVPRRPERAGRRLTASHGPRIVPCSAGGFPGSGAVARACSVGFEAAAPPGVVEVGEGVGEGAAKVELVEGTRRRCSSLWARLGGFRRTDTRGGRGRGARRRGRSRGRDKRRRPEAALSTGRFQGPVRVPGSGNGPRVREAGSFADSGA